MLKRVVTKVGYVYRTKDDHLLQLVAIDSACLNADVVVVYKNKNVDDLERLHKDPFLFYQHTIVAQGVRENLWEKIGKATIPDVSKLIFKQYMDKETVQLLHGTDDKKLVLSKIIKTRPFWYVWCPVDTDWRKVTEKKGDLINAEDSGISPASDIIYRIKYGRTEFRNSWEIRD